MMMMIDVNFFFKLSLFQREKDRSRCTAWLCKKPNSEEVKMYNLQLGDLSEEKYGIIFPIRGGEVLLNPKTFVI